MPDFFDKYQLIKRIAHGGIAEVFLARQVGDIAGFTKQVAIKRMFPHLIERDDIISMFIDEARIVADLNHPSIVQTFDLGVIDGSFYIVMEYVDGLDLRRVCEFGIANDAFLPAEIAVQIIIEAAAGLHYAHTRLDANGQSMGIVHRDVSPQNILISRQGAVKVCDFGIAKAERRLTTTRSGEFKGKFGYMSPEQAEGLSLDWRSDIFSLGILLYEITAATRLFRGFNEYETIKMVINAEVEPPTQFIPNFPRDLEAIILKALQRDPADRYQSAEELQIALEDWLFAHRQRVGAAQIARYMEFLFTHVPQDTENSQPDARAPAPTPVSAQHSEPSTPAVESPKPAQSALPKPGLSALPQSSPNTGLRLPTQRSVQASIAPAHSEDTVIIDNSDDDLTRPISVSESLIAEADAAYQFPSSHDLDNLPKPSLPTATEPLPKKPHVTLPGPARLQASLPQPQNQPIALTEKHAEFSKSQPSPRQQKSDTPIPTANQPANNQPANVQPAPSTDKTWSVDPIIEDDSDLDWAKSHTRRKTLLAAVFGSIFIAAIALTGWFLSQPEDLAKNNPNLAENAENNDAGIYRGPLLDHPKTTVLIDSDPPGAHIVVNGVLSTNSTPADVSLYRDVSNEIVLYAQGFLPHTLVLTPSATTSPQSIELTTRPQPVAGKLQINSNPPGGSITLNGETIGITPLSLDNIASHIEHHVQVSLPDHHTFAGFIHIMPGIDNTIDAQLASLDQPSREVFVELVYEALPRGSQILVDGEIRGISPFYANHNRDSLIQIVFKANDRQEMRRTIATSGIGSFLLRPYLTPIQREMGHISLNVKPTPSNIYIGSNAYDQKQLRNIELLEGEYDAVFETTDGTRIRSKIQVHPNKRTTYLVELSDDQAKITTAQR